MTLRITQYGESILHEKGKKVESFDDDLFQLSKDMLKAMHQVQGIGLAAQQVGKAIRFCVVDVPDHLMNITTRKAVFRSPKSEVMWLARKG